jgi:uncharacterized protein (TIGR03083 family)
VDHWQAIAAERRAIADQLDGLDETQWATPSLCAGWTVRDVAAHLVAPHEPGTSWRFALAFVVERADFDRANMRLTARVAARPPATIAADLRRHAESRFAPPGFGSVAPLTDVMVHHQDIAIPLCLPPGGPVAAWVEILGFLTGRKARTGFVPRRLPALRYVATDADFASGAGDEVRAPAAALALTLVGRPVRADELDGPGADRLRAWLRS